MVKVDKNKEGKPLKIPPQKGPAVLDKKTASVTIKPENTARKSF